jgi:curved DNA-binding protein CbpA
MSDLDRLDYYSLLGVRRSASLDDVKRAFRAFARRYHPDRFVQDAPEKIARATQIYQRGGEAFQVLSDPVLRAAYDRAREQGQLRMSSEEQQKAHTDARAPKPEKRPSIRSPQARAFYDNAAMAARARDWRGAWKALQSAAQIEPDSERIKKRLEQVEAKLRGRPADH